MNVTSHLTPTERYDGRITVLVLYDERRNRRVKCSSYRDAIATVKQYAGTAAVVKVEDRNGDVVFTSAEMDVEDWEREWESAKRRMGADADGRDCPHGNGHCFEDDLCLECQIDEVQSRSRSVE